jgi:nicotinic acid phosphoribosyltransferase
MPRMGVVEREETKSLILVCRARGYNYKQILSVVNDNLKKYNNSLSEKGLLHILQATKEEAKEWLRNLSIGKDAYVDEYRQRIMELNEQRRDLWEIVRKYENQPFVQISAHKEIHALTKSILQLYETLPLLVTNSNVPNGVIFSDSIYEDTTGKYPDLSA